MGFIIRHDNKPLKLKLARDRTKLLKQGYPWIYADWLAERPAAPAGSRAMVQDRDGSLIAFGMYDPESPLAVRVCAVESERLDDVLIEQRLERAMSLRNATFKDGATNGYRLLNGEGDGLPGLVCDRYGEWAVLKLDGEGPAGFWDLEALGQWLTKRAAISNVYMRDRTEERGRPVVGGAPQAPVEFKEHGIRFAADLVMGQKTGFFFDQRENRALIGSLSQDRAVLNLFGYTGGFSIYAGAGGARAVTTVDIAAPAIEAAQSNWKLNGLPAGRHSGVAADVFEFLERSSGEKWDIIVVDPPSFAPAERHVPKAVESYKALFTAALRAVSGGGIAALSSCSSHISFPVFTEICEAACSKARRRAQVAGIYGQPADHPFPLVCPELRYLKFFLLRLD